jgi:excisionase family DNA binding protein
MGTVGREGEGIRDQRGQVIPEVMGIAQAAEYLQISQDTLYIYAQQGYVPGFKLGNKWKFRLSKLDQWMNDMIDKQSGRPK